MQNLKFARISLCLGLLLGGQALRAKPTSYQRLHERRLESLKAIKALVVARRALESVPDPGDGHTRQALESVNQALAELKQSRYLQALPQPENEGPAGNTAGAKVAPEGNTLPGNA